MLQAIGFAAGGRPGARLAAALGLSATPAVIVAKVRAASESTHATPRVLGVDDWAVRRSQTSGTILLDLERHAVIDVLADREASTFATWLRAHPGVEIVSRDRGGAYAEAAREAAPDAIEIADRFHLLRNLTDALGQACTRHHRELRAVKLEVEGPPGPRPEWRRRRYSGLPNNRDEPTRHERRITENRARRLARFEQVVQLHAQGLTGVAIAHALELNRRTVATWLDAGTFPERRQRAARRRGTLLDPFIDFVTERHRAGVVNAAALYRELVPRGYRGSEMTVRRALIALRQRTTPAAPDPRVPRGDPPQDSSDAPPPLIAWPAGARVPNARQTVWLLRKPEEALRPDEQDYVELICAHVPALATARRLSLAFEQLLKKHDANGLAPWLETAAQSELRAFARGIGRDRDAVLAAILFQWSNGQVEGQVHRRKAIKRSMYGRARFDLLRKRVLHAT
jgi:transposase